MNQKSQLEFYDCFSSIEQEEKRCKIEKERLLKGDNMPVSVSAPRSPPRSARMARLLNASNANDIWKPRPEPSKIPRTIGPGAVMYGDASSCRRNWNRAVLPTGPLQPSAMSTSDVRSVVSCTTPMTNGFLSKSATTTRIGQHTPNAFGEKAYVSKEDHERERTRWLTKLDDIEKRLVDSETLNSEMVLIKAELNKKIVDLERSQRPLIEQNRKLGDRNRNLQHEVRKVEQKFCHSQDDFLTLKDAHERLLKENMALKEKRVSPEKLEELDRYRTQEKDKRYEVLVQKFKRLRKCARKGENEDDRASTVGSDCSATSTASLDTITEDFEEALEKDIQTNYQALYRENAELQRALNELRLNSTDLSEGSILREQITFAQTTIAQQQILIDANQEMMSQAVQLKATVTGQQDRIRKLEQQVEELTQKLAAEKDTNDLLEFQVLEMEENSRHETIPKVADKAIETHQVIDKEPVVLEKVPLLPAQIVDIKSNLSELRNADNLKLEQCQIVSKAEVYIEHLEDRVTSTTDLEGQKSAELTKAHNLIAERTAQMTEKCAQNEKLQQQLRQFEEKSRTQESFINDYADKIKKLQAQLDDSNSKQKKGEDLQKEVEAIKQQLNETNAQKTNLNEEVKALSKELGKCRFQLQGKESDLEKEMKMAEALSDQLQVIVRSSQEEASKKEEELQKLRAALLEAQKNSIESIESKKTLQASYDALLKEYEEFKADQRPSIRTELERRFEETRYRLNSALEKIHDYELLFEAAKKAETDGKLSEKLENELIELKEFNAHLERQFQSQSDIIEALKKKIIQQKTLSDLVVRLSHLDDSPQIEDELILYARDQEREDAKLPMGIACMLKEARKNPYFSPLEISTAHHKVIYDTTYLYEIRPYNSVDSSGEWLSNSSEGIVSPDEHDNEDWNNSKEKTAKTAELSTSTHSS